MFIHARVPSYKKIKVVMKCTKRSLHGETASITKPSSAMGKNIMVYQASERDAHISTPLSKDNYVYIYIYICIYTRLSCALCAHSNHPVAKSQLEAGPGAKGLGATSGGKQAA
jgi:hypothetical protein